jgi:hypothetical protein
VQHDPGDADRWAGSTGHGGLGGAARVVRLVTAVFLLGSVLLIVLLVGQGMVAAQQLPPSPGAAQRAPATGPGVAGPSAAVRAGVLGRTPAGREVVAGLDQAARTLEATGTPAPATPTGRRPAGTPGSSEQPAGPAPDLRTPAAKRLEMDLPGELRGDGDDPQPGPQGAQGTLVAAAAAAAVVAQRQPARPIAIGATATKLMDIASGLAQATREHSAHNPDSIVQAKIEPDPRTEPNPLVEQVRDWADQALGLEKSDPGKARAALGNTAKALAWEADWSMGVAEQLYKNARALARQADQAGKAQAIKDEHAQPLLRRAVDAWNQAVDVGAQLGDPHPQGRYNFEKVRELLELRGRKGSLLDDPEPSEADSRFADAEAEPATPPAHAQPAAQEPPAAVSGDLDRTPLETAAFDPTESGSTLASTGEGTGSPGGVQQPVQPTSMTAGDSNDSAGLDASFSPDDGGALVG